MKVYIRNSSLKSRKMTGFRRRMKTRAGRDILNRQRRRSLGLGKYNRKPARKF
jgi:large subunit ribosomal protein L34